MLIYIYIYIYIHTHTHIYIYVCVCVCIYIYQHGNDIWYSHIICISTICPCPLFKSLLLVVNIQSLSYNEIL